MDRKLEVIFEDNHLLVVNKPPLISTMGARHGHESLIDAAKRYIKRKHDKPGNVYLGVVSRLDSVVSGVIVFARTSKAAARLNQQFAQGKAIKKYWAIVTGDCPASAELENWMLKDEVNRRMVTVKNGRRSDAKHARLRFKKIGEFGDLHLLEIRLLTGRKHQIRVQLSARGSPVVGDRKYGSKVPFKTGIALHSRSLTIDHPTKKIASTFTSDPPEYWNVGRFLD